jgi:serine/threonine protein kinase/Flp pilus assembly protein TadD
MGEVYKALDTQLNRLVALKVILDKYSEDEHCVKRFEQEARAVSGLNHPHILTVYDIGTVEGKTFIATEFVDGQTLRKRIQDGAVDISSVLEIAFQTADALMAAHRAAILHRDIKPENIMLRNDGHVKLLDFGLAKLIAPSNPVTQTLPGVIVGTPQYMSPEQARGSRVDTRTDIWSFGVVLYEMVTGFCPFSGSTVDEIIDCVLKKQPHSVFSYKPDLLPDLELIITKAMSKNVRDRYESFDHVVSDLKRAQHTFISARPAGNYTTVKATVPAAVVPNKASRGSKSRARKIKTLAILPFTNETHDSKIDYLSDGITETIINKVSQLPQLRVMSRTSVFRFKGADLAPTAIGQELGVGAVLTGKLLRVRARLIVQAELVDVRDGSQVWGIRYDVKTLKFFEIEERIAAEISEKLQLKLTTLQRRRLKKRHTTNENAYFNYLKGRFHWNKRSAESVKLAIGYFNQAIEDDPLFAVAFSGLADCYVVLGNQHSLPAREAFPKAKAAAIRALEIDDSLAEAYVNLGYVKATLDRDWSGSLKAFEKAISLNPEYATAHQWYSVVLIALGRFDESLAESRKACELDPLSRVLNASFGQCLYFARRYEEAIQQYKRMLSIDDDFHWTHYFMASAYRQQKRYKEALAEFRLALKLVKDEPVILCDLIFTYALAGQKRQASILLKKLKKMASDVYVSPYDLAIAHLGVGDKETALDLLEESERGRDDGILMINIDPALDALRDHPRFKDILIRDGLAQSSTSHRST